MNHELLSKFLTMAGPLVGAIVGGLIAAFSTWALERQKWRRDRHGELMSLTREAIAAALEWIDPMRNAEISASSSVMAALHGNIEHEEFLKGFPNAFTELSKRDLPGNLRAVLPADTYARGHQIVREIRELRPLGVRCCQAAGRKGAPTPGFVEVNGKLNAIGKLIGELETDLRQAFQRTFE